MKQKIYKNLVRNYFCALLIIFLSLAGCAAIVFYIIDPMQFFHRSFFLPANMLWPNMREQAVGIINNYDHDSAILGTSMLENTSTGEAGRKLGGKFINISLRASDLYERSIVLKRLLKNDLKRVIYSMDHYYLYLSQGNKDFSNWSGLYSWNPLRYFIYYATKENFLNLFRKNRGLESTDLDTPFAWKFQPRTVARFGGLKNWVDDIECFELQDLLVKSLLDVAGNYDLAAGVEEKHDFANEAKVYRHLEEYLLKHVREHPETEFDLVFPPYYRMTFAKWLKLEPELFFAYLNSIRYLVRQKRQLPNLHIYGLENEDFLDNIALYSDPYHYHPDINGKILDAIQQGRELTEDNMEAYLAQIQQRARDFDLPGFVARTREMIAQRKSLQPHE